MADKDLGRDRLAELMAFIRGSDECGEGAVPTQWVMEVLSVYMSNMGAGGRAPSEEEIEAKVGYLDALKIKIGEPQWCELYATEMGGAHIMFQFNAEHPQPSQPASPPPTMRPLPGGLKDCSAIPPKDRTLDCAL